MSDKLAHSHIMPLVDDNAAGEVGSANLYIFAGSLAKVKSCLIAHHTVWKQMVLLSKHEAYLSLCIG